VSRYPYRLDGVGFDVLVIGAGINGVAIARDAAMRGLRVACIDKGDIGSGTTGWSTRLIHGGLRYLEHFEVPLVRESLRERRILSNTAPHLVRPLQFVIPIYQQGSRGAGLIRLGMLAYDVLSFDKASREHHRMLSPAETLDLAPGLDPEGLKGGALYSDAQAEFPERLVVENALSALEHGAILGTYTRLTGFRTLGDRAVAARVVDEWTGGQQLVHASVIVNATGPWVDAVLDELNTPHPRLIGGTKGSHLVVAPFPGAPRTALYTEAQDNRPYFIVPWGECYLIGTTDERFDGDLDDVEASAADVDYLVESTNRVVPAAGLTRDSVLWTYSGVRPLPYQPDAAEGEVTRKHLFVDHPRYRNVLSVVGGKLTTHRGLAEEAVDRVFERLRRKAPPCHTADEPLPGARTPDWPRFADSFRECSGLPPELAGRLLSIYGARATRVLDFAGDDPTLQEPVAHDGTLAAEIGFAVRSELATTLSDVYLRRTMTGLRGDQGAGSEEEAATLAIRMLSWSPDRASREVADYRSFLARSRQPATTRS
jgi:glycerol-3-phosphate dehydrogenase